MPDTLALQAAMQLIRQAQAASERLPKQLAADLYTASACVAGPAQSPDQVWNHTAVEALRLCQSRRLKAHAMPAW